MFRSAQTIIRPLLQKLPKYSKNNTFRIRLKYCIFTLFLKVLVTVADDGLYTPEHVVKLQ